MSPRYLIVDYNDSKSKDPGVAIETDDLKDATRQFEKLSEGSMDASVVLYDSKKDTVLQLSIKSEPILLVKAIECARTRYGKSTKWLKHRADDASAFAGQKAASLVIGRIAQRLAGGPLPGFGGAIMGHVIAPYYAAMGDGASAAGAAVGGYGSLSGGVIGFVIGGPMGAFFGALLGSAVLGVGTTQLIRTLTHPDPCKNCKGTGLDGNFYRCEACNGYGYSKGKI